jgi:SAM-dependent methyltransferase
MEFTAKRGGGQRRGRDGNARTSSSALVDGWRREEQAPFSGWDFAHLEGRMIEEQPPWSYSSRAAALMRLSSSAIDLGTGGGERLLALREHWPAKVVATEGHPPNFRLATARLSGFGVTVVGAPAGGGDRMPFADGEFDLVLDRHSGFDPEEVVRILAPLGSFLTQQIHGLWMHDLIEAFRRKPPWPDATLERYVPQLAAAGLTMVDAREWSGRICFADVGAVVYYLRAVPWLVRGFAVASHLRYLEELQDRLDAGKRLCFVARKYLIEARKERAPAG